MSIFLPFSATIPNVTATGAATPRPLADHFADMPTIRDFGARGDGVTNDTAAFLTALASGMPFTVTPGTYVVSAALTFPARAVMLGVGNPTLKFSGNMTPGCILTSGDSVTIRGVTVDADKASKSGTCNGIYLTNNDALVEYVNVKNAHDQGIKITGDRNFVRYGSVTASTGPNIQILGPTVLAAPGTAGGSFNRIEGMDVTGGAGFGIHLDDAAHENLLMTNRCTTSGLELIGITYSCYRNRIIGNHAQGTGDNGISVTGYENLVQGNISIANANTGIFLYGMHNTCTGNVCMNNNQSRLTTPTNTFSGITLGASWGGLSSYNTCTGNTCLDDQAVPTQEYGINLATGFYPAWTSTGALTTYPYVTNGLNVYKRVGGSTTTMGTTAPVHTTVSDVSDGSVTWRFVATVDTNVNGKYNTVIGNTCRGNRTAALNNVTGNAHTIVHDGVLILNGGSNGTNPTLPLQVITANGAPTTLGTLGNPGDLFLRRGGSTGITGYLKEGGANDSTNWVAILTRKTGSSANRPSGLGIGYEGYYYYDQTVGKPLFWNGAGWRDATSAVLQVTATTATTTIDPGLYDEIEVTLQANTTIVWTTTNLLNGKKWTVRYIQDATGGRTVTHDAATNKFGASMPSFTASAAASTVDYVGYVYSSSATKAHVVSASNGF